MPPSNTNTTNIIDGDDNEYTVPLQDQRVFGAGLKRKRVHFVPASADDAEPSPQPPAKGVGDYYLSIVLGKDKQADTSATAEVEPAPLDLCPTCHTPLPPSPQTKPHESTLPHQLSLPASHPPSSLPRQHIGLKYLCRHGWDPDSRLGLGKSGEGRTGVVKVRWKADTVGLGVKVDKGFKGQRRDKVGKLLGAKEVRDKVEGERRKGERLREEFWGRVDVDAYLNGRSGG
ncbi:MAG: hypothetical protein M1839_006825 [Geoglossum umbratile]|nr:MAG: hypothetical protein M1839_006825 [Geoglossum umbratile]